MFITENIQELTDKINEISKRDKERINYLLKEIDDLKSGIFEKDLIKQYQKDLEIYNANQTFCLDIDEQKKVKEWLAGKDRHVGVSGGDVTYTFRPTGLGTIVTARCQGDELLIRDFL